MSDGFVESWMLGSIAGSLSSQNSALAADAVFANLQHKQAMAQADADYAALADDYNNLVDQYETLVGRFNHVYTCAKEWMVEGEKRNQRIAEANQRASAAEQRVTAVEAHAQALALREAEARRDAEFYEARYTSVGEIATNDARKLRQAREEIVRLQAIIDASGASGT